MPSSTDTAQQLLEELALRETRRKEDRLTPKVAVELARKLCHIAGGDGRGTWEVLYHPEPSQLRDDYLHFKAEPSVVSATTLADVIEAREALRALEAEHGHAVRHLERAMVNAAIEGATVRQIAGAASIGRTAVHRVVADYLTRRRGNV